MAGLNANDEPQVGGNGKDRVEQEALAPKLYPARVVQVVDIGLQPRKAFKGEVKAPMHHIRLTYEITGEFMKDEDGKDREDMPRWVSEKMPFYNIKADKATSTIRMKAIDHEGVTNNQFTELVGMPCQVYLIKEPHPQYEGQEINYVDGVTAPISVAGYEQPPLINPTTVFILDDPDMAVFKELPEFLQKQIQSNLEFNGSKLQTLLGVPDNVVPVQADGLAEPEESAPVEPPAPPKPPAPAKPVPDVPQ